MKMLVLGASSFARRRVIPILANMTAVSQLAVASRSVQLPNLPPHNAIKIYNDYALAISKFEPDVVYVSVINSLHHQWVKSALENNCHVVVDKPAFLSLSETESMLSLAKSKRRCLAEALVYEHHSQIQFIKEFLHEKNAAVKTMVAQFSFPPFEKGNFRNHPECGGGAINDLGPYASSIGRIFFGSSPISSHYHRTEYHAETGVDTAFTLSADYGKGRGYAGVFGFNTQYRNRVSLLCDKLSIDIDRIFTTPPDDSSILHINEGMQQYSIQAPASDAVHDFFQLYFSVLANGNHDLFQTNLLEDAIQVDSFRKNKRLSRVEHGN